MTKVIAYAGDRPPIIVPEPCNYSGALWTYRPATPEEARRALEHHAAAWSDWAADNELVALAASAASAPWRPR